MKIIYNSFLIRRTFFK